MFDCLSHIFKYTFCPRGAVSFYRLSALISMAMTLPTLNTTHNSNPVCNTDLALHCDNILLSHWILCILRGSRKRRKLECADLFHADYPSLVSKLKKRWVGQQYIVIFHLTCTSQQHSLVSAKTLSMFSTNHIMWCEEVTNKKAQGRGKVFYVGGAVGGGSISAYKYYAK